MLKKYIIAFSFIFCCVGRAITVDAMSFRTLYTFNGLEAGGNPAGVTFAPNDALYGWTQSGGNLKCGRGLGCGVIFSLDLRNLHYEVLYTNDIAADMPDAIITASNGRVFGTFPNGGKHSQGSVFEITRSGGKEVVHTVFSFPGASGGSVPAYGLTPGPNGTLFGTTQDGGDPRYNEGVVFELVPHGSTFDEHVLWKFGARADGIGPGGVALMPDGTVVGSTFAGGTQDVGVFYSLTTSGSGYVQHILYSFKRAGDAHGPLSAMLIDKAGDVFATSPGGKCNGPGCSSDLGCAVELFPTGRYEYADRLLYSFKGRNDGQVPGSPLALGAAGSFFGTTLEGSGPYSDGIIYELTPAGNSYQEKITHAFRGSRGGGAIGWGVTPDKTLYGVTVFGGSTGFGTIFQYVP